MPDRPRHSLGPLLWQGPLTTTTRARLFSEEDGLGASRPCAVEQLLPSLACCEPLAARYADLAQQHLRAPVPGARPLLAVEQDPSEVGRPNPKLFLDLAEARPLRALLDEHAGKLPLDLAVLLVGAVAEAVEGVHQAGHFHGLLTPEHVLLDASGRAWLDGLCAAVAARDHLPDDEWPALAQPPWRAPETARRQPQPSCDLYFLGAVLHRLLTGEPHPEEWEPKWSFLMARLHGAGVDGHRLGALVRWLHRTLAERPSQRFASAKIAQEQLALLGPDPESRRWDQLLELLWAPARSGASPALPRPDETTDDPPDPSEVLTRAPGILVRGPQDLTRLMPDASPSLSSSVWARIGPHPLEILARSRYEVLQELGVGGMGTVYQARDRELDQVVALKVLHRDLLTRNGALERFRRELRLTRELNHPHIIPAYHLESFEGLYLYSMRYIEGPTLRAWLRQRGPQPSAQAAQVLVPIADAVGCAHAAGIVHRDVKTTNIMMELRPGAPPHPWLMDFGIAVNRSLPQLTHTGQPLGTPQYMPPEQALGQEVGPAADIYSLGVVLWELLTGQTPFPGETSVAVYDAQIHERYQELGELAPLVPAEVRALLVRCLRPRPEQRPASVQEFLSVLRPLSP